MGVEIRDIWNELQNKELKPALAMSIYKDVIYLAIEEMISDEHSETNRRLDPARCDREYGFICSS